jgi:hypothetical protein
MKKGLERVGRDIQPDRAARGCFDKKTFDSRNQARDHAIRGEKLNGNQPQEPYRCHICGLWHLTSLDKQGRAKARRRDWIPATNP